MSSTRSTRIAVTIEGREDRGILVYSDDLPGLILSGPDAEAVLAGVEAAVTYLFADRGRKVERVVTEIPLTEALAIEGPNPPSKGRGSGTETAYYTVLFDEDARAAA